MFPFIKEAALMFLRISLRLRSRNAGSMPGGPEIIQDEFESTLEILASDRTGLLADLTNQLSSMHIFIHALNSRELKDNNAIIYATITVNGLEHFKNP